MTHPNFTFHSDWITDHLPTEADADCDGDVRIPCTVDQAESEPANYSEVCYCHHSLIVPGQPWWSSIPQPE